MKTVIFYLGWAMRAIDSLAHNSVKNFLISCALLWLLGQSVTCIARTEWTEVNPKLYYTEMTTNPWGGKLHAFKFELKDYALSLVTSQHHKKTRLSIKDMVTENHALIGINGGFFSPEWKPLGLRISKNEIINPFKSISWWGVAYVEQDKMHIVSSKDYVHRRDITFAVQSGPRLIVDHHRLNLKPGIAERSAICTTAHNQVIISIVNNQPLTIDKFAELLAADEEHNGLNCRDALNLDGGSSSQLYSNIHNLKLHLAGLSHITDGILIHQKNNI